MKKLLSTIALISAFATLSFGQNFPFPQNENGYTYPYGITASTPDNAKIQSRFVSWDNAMYRESTDGTLGRIRFDTEGYTVSEGIGYGMLIYVYMANETNTQCQDRFDKLYAYYKNFSNSRSLMNWKIEGFTSVNGYNAATDADLDVALALCLAAKQWGSSSKYNYTDEAEKILNNIYTYEVTTKNGLKVFKPGDSWDSYGNPCYFTVASVGVFDQAQTDLGFSTVKDWETVYDDSHSYLELCQRNGLWPNWSNWDGSPATSKSSDAADFGWDACRTPWRIAWDYAWYGTESSKTMLGKTIALLSAKNILSSPTQTGYFTGLTGSGYSSITLSSMGGNSAFMGSIACAFMSDENYQSSLDTYYSSLKNRSESPYYSPTLQMLYLITLSGNAANFFDLDNGEPAIKNPVVLSGTTSGGTIVLTTSRDMITSNNYSDFSLSVNGSVISNAFSSMSISEKNITLNLSSSATLAAGDLISISYAPTTDTLKSSEGGNLCAFVSKSITNTLAASGSTLLADCENEDVTLLGGTWYGYVGVGTSSYEIIENGANSTAHCAHFTYNNISDYAGMGFNLLDPEGSYNCLGSTGISFYHKGSAAILEIGTTSTSDYSYHYYNVPSHTNWTLVTLNWSDILQTNWGNGSSLNFVDNSLASEIIKFQWKETSGSGEFWIDEFSLIGKKITVDNVDRNSLITAIDNGNTLYGNAAGNYPSTAITTLYNAIVTASAVKDNPSASQTNVDNATTTLNNAITTFKATAYGDKTELGKLITSAQTLSTNAIVGSDNGNYTQTSKNSLDEAINEAQIVYNTIGVSQTNVDDAVENLTNEINAFKASVINIVNKDNLLTLINTVTEKLAGATSGNNVGNYPSVFVNSLKSDLSSARIIYAKTSATQEEIDNSYENLKDSYDSFLESVITTAIEENKIVLSVYPNPCSDYLNIVSDKEIAQIKIVSITGLTEEFEENKTNVILNISDLANGLYFLQISFDNGTTTTSKFLKK